MDLKNLKSTYDKLLKEYENRDYAFRTDYPVYFKPDIFYTEIISTMSLKDKEAYKNGAGNELLGEMPSMSSVASSSRFCYLSLKDSDLKVFGFSGNAQTREFEKKLPITRGTPPHMDAYIENETEIFYFECKCHEMFDDHRILLSKSYFQNNLLVTKIPKDFILDEVEVKSRGKVYKKIEVSPRAFGIMENPRFDIKQFLTHIMGIEKQLERIKTSTGISKNAHLIYYYFIPNKILNNPAINEVIEILKNEMATVINSTIITTNIVNIDFQFFVQFSDTVETTTKDNTKRLL